MPGAGRVETEREANHRDELYDRWKDKEIMREKALNEDVEILLWDLKGFIRQLKDDLKRWEEALKVKEKEIDDVLNG